MPLVDMKTIIANDVESIFLTDFAVDATYTTGAVSSTVKVQFFNSALDGMDTLYSHIWCEYLSGITKSDTFTIGGIVYGVVDFEHDEFLTATDIFVQEV